MNAVDVRHGDCLDVLATLAPESASSCVTDPPYHLTSIVKRFSKPDTAPAQEGRDGAFARVSKGFMGKQWDGGDVAFRADTWGAVKRVLKPGAYLAAFSAARTYHRMASAIEAAGFIICDQLDWIYGSGFPKASDLGRVIDKHLGQPGSPQGAPWAGWSTQLKPAHEPICLAQKPIRAPSIVKNVLTHGAGALNIGACRIGVEALPAQTRSARDVLDGAGSFRGTAGGQTPERVGRWPANVMHDGSAEVERAFASFGETASSPPRLTKRSANIAGSQYGASFSGNPQVVIGHGNAGSPSRFFYSAKADADDRCGSKHPTIKPVDMMAWLVRLVTPPGGLVLDPLAGTGSTGMACLREGFPALLIEREEEYIADIHRRLAHVSGADAPLFSPSSYDPQPELFNV